HPARAHGVDRDRLAQPGQDRRGRPAAARGRPGAGGGRRSRPVTFTAPVLDIGALAPTIILSVAAMIVLTIGAFVTARGLLTGLRLIGVAAAFVTSLGGRAPGDPNALVVGDGMATFFNVVILLVAAITVFLSADYLDRHEVSLGEFYALLLFCCAGM